MRQPITAVFVSSPSSVFSSRRGSNVSLVLDMSALGSVEPMNVAVAAPREAAAREYLLSAKRPLTRQQLHDLLNNAHKLHAEFAVRHTRADTGFQPVDGRFWDVVSFLSPSRC